MVYLMLSLREAEWQEIQAPVAPKKRKKGEKKDTRFLEKRRPPLTEIFMGVLIFFCDESEGF